MSDFSGNRRPHPIDDRIDIGAIESPYEGDDSISDTDLLKTENRKLIIYPNPTNSLFTIETGQPDRHSIEINSLNGQLICSTIIEGTSHQIDLSSFQEGFYFITVRSKDFVTTRKIIKQ